ncbi:MAG: hypothetical protein ACI8UO_004537 [Verrucomicrobiales bacterium]|jgi:hypothetical protein
MIRTSQKPQLSALSMISSNEPADLPLSQPSEVEGVTSAVVDSVSTETQPDLESASMIDFFETPAPLVVTGETALELSAYLQRDLLNKLELESEETQAILFSPELESGILGSLAEALSASFPGLTTELLESVAPDQWGILIRALIRRTISPAKRRVLIVDDFDTIFLSPQGEREQFTRVLAQIARDPSITVVIGIPEGSVLRCSKLPGLKQSLREGAKFRATDEIWAKPALSPSSRAAQKLRNGGDTFYKWLLDVSDTISDMAVGRMAAIATVTSAVVALAIAGVMFFAFPDRNSGSERSSQVAAAIPSQNGATEIAVLPEPDPIPITPSGDQQLLAAPGAASDPNIEATPVFGDGEAIEIIMGDEARLPPTNLTPVSSDSARRPESKPGNNETQANKDGAPAGDDGDFPEKSASSSADASSGRGEGEPELNSDD